MPVATQPPPSFSPVRKWGIGFSVILTILLVTAVVAMLNYLGQLYFLRFHWSGLGKTALSPQTRTLLHSLTNQVKIIVYYDKDDPLYPMVVDMANEFKLANPKLSVRLVDYKRDPATALQLRDKYPFLASPDAKNLVIFDCDGRVKPVEGNVLAKYAIERVPNPDEPFRRKLTAFSGEVAFDATLLAVTSPKKLQAYFLQGDGEANIAGKDPQFGYDKFASILAINYIESHPLSLLGTNPVPADCNLLIIAGPTDPIPQLALDKIDQYLSLTGLFLYITLRVIESRRWK